MDSGIYILGAAALGAVLGEVTRFIRERSELPRVKNDFDKLKVSNKQLEENYQAIVDAELARRTSKRQISFQLLAIESYLQKDMNNNRDPILEILGINALGPLHQGRELVRDILKSQKDKGYGGKVRILLLDPTSDSWAQRVRDEGDTIGRLAAEMCASFYILADISENLGPKESANLEIRLHGSYPGRSLVMLDVWAAGSNEAATTTDIVSKHKYGVILHSPYHTDLPTPTRGLEGESFRWTLENGAAFYKENLEYFRDLWNRARVIPVPKDHFDLGSCPAGDAVGLRRR